MELDATSDEIRKWGDAAIAMVADYLGSIRDRPLYPNTTAQAIRQQVDRNLPVEPRGFDELLKEFQTAILEASRHNGHPRMFGYVQAPGSGLGAIADLIASALNANLTAWRSAPAPVELERITIDWIKRILGYPDSAAGLFVSGGSMANFAALAAARTAKAPSDFAKSGTHSVPATRMCVYASEQTHHSIEKAAVLLGVGSENVRKIKVDGQHKIRIDDLVAQIEDDLQTGNLPFCVVANAGTVMTGAVDPLAEVHEVAQRFNLWMHVDAAYGGFAVLSESAKPLFSGVALADSIALDPHKWLYLPVDCGCILYREPATARAAFAHQAEYTRVIGQEADEAFAFWDYGPELSRRFRALKVWMLLRGVGIQALGGFIEKDLQCALHLERAVRASEDFEMLAPVELSIFCFRHLPAHLKSMPAEPGINDLAVLDEQLNSWNERLLIALQHDGSSYLSNALVNGRFALRGCVMNYRTTLQDMDRLLDDLRRVARELPTS